MVLRNIVEVAMKEREAVLVHWQGVRVLAKFKQQL